MAQSIEKRDRLPIFRRRLNELLGEMSTTEFAEKVGLSRQTMGFYLNGDRIPDSITLSQICRVCGVTADWLLGLTNDPCPKPCAVDDLGLSNLAIESIKGYTKEQKEGLTEILENELFRFVCDGISQYMRIPNSEKPEILSDEMPIRYIDFAFREGELENQLVSGNPDLDNRVKVLIGYNYTEFMKKHILDKFEQLIYYLDRCKNEK